MQAAPSLTLVLATVGRRDELLPLLQSLRVQTERRFELIVVDQNVDDRLQPLLQSLAADGVPLRHLRLAGRNLSRARNLGLREAQGAVVAFPDDDAWYEPDTLQRAVAALAQRPLDDGLIAWWVDAGPARAGLAEFAAWRRFRGGEASSITLFLRTRSARLWGGFDERLGTGQWYGAGEETDLLLRALAAGACLRHVPSVRVRHAPPDAVPPTWLQALQRARGTGALYAKHRLGPAVLARGLAAPWRWPVAGPGGPGAAVALGRLQGWIGWTLSAAFESR